MRVDPRVLRWLRREWWGFWVCHGGVLVVGGCLVLVLSGAVLLGLGFVSPGMPATVRHSALPARGWVCLLCGAAAGWMVWGRWAAWMWKASRPWIRMDLSPLARAITVLARRPEKVSLGELRRRLPGVDVRRLAADLARVPGVVWLDEPPAGLALTDRLRRRLGAPVW